MTREEAIKKHRELWHWIANEIRRRKVFYVPNKENPDVANEKPHNDCWLCEYVNSNSTSNSCEDCPINWGRKTCIRDGSPYNEFIFSLSLDYEERANLADIIAELPEKGEE